MSGLAQMDGLEAGLKGYRAEGPNVVPHSHPLGSTPEGASGF